MSQLHSTTKATRIKHSHLTLEIRQKLEGLVQANHKLAKKKQITQKFMAEILRCSEATISRELVRGEVYLLASDLSEYKSYSAVISQEKYLYAATNKGPSLKLGNDYEFATYVKNKITKEKWSPDAIIMDLKKQQEPQFKTMVSTRTLYNYIHNCLIPGVESKDLPRKGMQERRKYQRVRRANKNLDAPMITDRPIESTNRTEPGHWEMDCIVSGRGKGKEALLTLNDRCCRETKIFKLKAQTQAEVIKVLNRMERSMGRAKFSQRFKTITVDNGSEFLDWRALEKSVTGTKLPRTKVYFCHPYSAFERGTNEQSNGVIRYQIPKGSAIRDYTAKQIQEIEDWHNNYPRRVLGGLTAIESREMYYHPEGMNDTMAAPTRQDQAQLG